MFDPMKFMLAKLYDAKKLNLHIKSWQLNSPALTALQALEEYARQYPDKPILERTFMSIPFKHMREWDTTDEPRIEPEF